MIKVVLTFLICVFALAVNAQHTVGTTNLTNGVSDGYTLFSPLFSFNTYLIDNCGRVINEWQSDYRPGLSVYLLEDGTLMRTARGGGINTDFTAGGVGGGVQLFDWNGNLIWQFLYSTPNYVQHHDIEVMPNGNVLLISFEKKTTTEAIDNGRNPSLLADNELWPDKIVEIQPIGIDSGIVVWEWHMWDHLIQDYDSLKLNYGVVRNHPELINLNYAPFNVADWAHFNSIDYNQDRDEIVISSRSFNELWVIDHSTTTAEAASHVGGNKGKGGDILYRWGNNLAYNAPLSNAALDRQHDIEWIEPGKKDEGSIMIFDNGSDRGYSSVKIVTPILDSNSNYLMNPDTTFGPVIANWEYIAPVPTDFHSASLSGANRMLNGNVFICEGTKGKFTEIDSLNNIVWEYLNPLTNSGTATQGGALPGANNIFKAIKYDVSFSGFSGKDLTPGQPLELNPDLSNCILTSNEEIIHNKNIQFYPNPFKGYLNFSSELLNKKITIYNVFGGIVFEEYMTKNYVDLSFLSKGIYWIKTGNIVEKVSKL